MCYEFDDVLTPITTAPVPPDPWAVQSACEPCLCSVAYLGGLPPSHYYDVAYLDPMCPGVYANQGAPQEGAMCHWVMRHGPPGHGPPGHVPCTCYRPGPPLPAVCLLVQHLVMP